MSDEESDRMDQEDDEDDEEEEEVEADDDDDDDEDEGEELNDDDVQPAKRSRRERGGAAAGGGAEGDEEEEEGEIEDDDEEEEEEEEGPGGVENDFAETPNELKDLRACKTCRLIKGTGQWEGGCDNCGDEHHQTSPNFTGMIAMIQPDKSWVAKWQGAVASKPGLYAIWVEGEGEGYQDEDDD